jgi:hypothetical protein
MLVFIFFGNILMLRASHPLQKTVGSVCRRVITFGSQEVTTMKKLLGLFICLGALIALTTGTTGCKKPETKVTPPKDTPAKDTPAKDTPAKDTPAKDTPAKDTPAKDTPAKDTPAKDTPAKEAGAKNKDNKISISDPKDVTVKDGAEATVKATVTLGADVKSATVTADIKVGKAKVSPDKLTKSGDVTVTVTGAPVGDHTLTITATGDGAAAPASTKVAVKVEKK